MAEEVGKTVRKKREKLDPALLKLAAVLVVGGIAPFLDTTIVTVALHKLSQGLSTPVSTIQWVSTGYLLAFAMAVPVSGWAADRWGTRPMWLGSLALFLLGSVLCGLAWGPASLIVFRVVQGIGGGLLQPMLQTILVRAAGPRRLGRIITVVTLVAVLAPILGPVVGGAIVNGASWRWIFFVNVPVCVVALVLAWRGLPAGPPVDRRRLDVLGIALLCPGVAALVYGLAEVGVTGRFGSVTVVVPVVVGAVLLVVFGFRSRRGGSVMDVRLFRVRSFSASAALLFISGLSLYGAMLLLPLYYQQIRGATALVAGLLLAPQGIGSLLTRWAGGLTDRIGARPIVLVGMALAALGTLPYTQITAHTGEWLLGAALVVRGAGLSAATVSIVSGAYRDLAPPQIADASGMIRIVQQLGGSFGTAVLAVVIQRASDVPVFAFRDAFWCTLAAAVLAFLPALFLPGVKQIRAASA